MTLHAAISGDLRNAAPLVLLHGFGGGAFVWDEVAASLGGDVPVMAYDMPGHGRSLADEHIGGAGRMAKAIASDIERRGIGRFHLAGHSMGGAVAALMAFRAPDRVCSLTLFSPGGFGPDIDLRALSAYAFAQSREEMRAALAVMAGPDHPLHESVVDAFLEARRKPGATAALRTILSSIAADPETMRTQGTLPLHEMAKLECPVRVVWGDRDAILPVSQSQGLPDNVAVHRIAGAGHMLIDECPQQAAQFIRRSLAEAGMAVSANQF